MQQAASICGLPWQILAAVAKVESDFGRAMARYLCASGAPGDIRAALFAYNHAEWYVDQVLAIAIRYGYGQSSAPSNRVVELARSQIGMPYVYGGESPQTGFDCSGLVQWVYAQIGINLPRTAQAQYDATQRVARDALAPGDLVFYSICCQQPDWVTHVGIYVGNGMMIDAPYPGAYVRMESIDTPYWQSHWAGAGRVVIPSTSRGR
jgi:hypothetical protein